MKEFKANLKPKIGKIEILSKINSSSILSGMNISSLKGKGLEFEQYRKYVPTDDARMIDWKATLRSKTTLVREVIDSKNVDVFFLFDVSSTMSFSSVNLLKNEYAAEIISSLSYRFLEDNNKVGLAFFNDTIVKQIPLTQGAMQFSLIQEALKNPENYDGKCDVEFALKYIIQILKRGTVVILVSDFLGFKHGWKKYLKIVSQLYDVIGIMIRDPRDYFLPENHFEIVVEDPLSSDRTIVDSKKIAERYKIAVHEDEKQIKTLFNSLGLDLIKISTNESFINPLIKLFIQRARMKVSR